MPIVLILLFTLLILPKNALAEVKVEISNNLDGSNNNVHVNSDTSSNNHYSGDVQSQTTIKINNNGEVKEYKGNGENVELKSSDGKSSVSVNTNGATNNPVQSSAKVNSKTNITVNSNTSDASPSSTPEATVAGVTTQNTDENEDKPGLLEFIKRQFKELFTLFS